MSVDRAFSAEDYEARAAKWARLANLTHDRMVQSEILEVRRTYIELAARVRRHEGLGGDLSILQPPGDRSSLHGAQNFVP